MLFVLLGLLLLLSIIIILDNHLTQPKKPEKKVPVVEYTLPGCPKCGSHNWVPSPVWSDTRQRLYKEDFQCVSCGKLFNLPGVPAGTDGLIDGKKIVWR